MPFPPALGAAITAASALGGIFGGKSKSRIKSESSLNPWQQQIAAILGPLIAGKMGKGVTPYTGWHGAPQGDFWPRGAPPAYGPTGGGGTEPQVSSDHWAEVLGPREEITFTSYSDYLQNMAGNTEKYKAWLQQWQSKGNTAPPTPRDFGSPGPRTRDIWPQPLSDLQLQAGVGTQAGARPQSRRDLFLQSHPEYRPRPAKQPTGGRTPSNLYRPPSYPGGPTGVGMYGAEQPQGGYGRGLLTSTPEEQRRRLSALGMHMPEYGSVMPGVPMGVRMYGGAQGGGMGGYAGAQPQGGDTTRMAPEGITPKPPGGWSSYFGEGTGGLPPTVPPNYPNVFVAQPTGAEMAAIGEAERTVGGAELPQTREFRERYMPEFERALVSDPMQRFGGALTGAEQAQYGKAMQFGGGSPVSPLTSSWSSMLERSMSGEPSTDISPEATERFFEESIKAPAMQTWKQDIMPQILEGRAAGGALRSSGTGEALARSGERLQTGLTSERARLMYADEQARRQLAESGAGRALSAAYPGLAGIQYGEARPLREMGALSQYGGAPRDVWSQIMPYGAQELGMVGGMAQQAEQRRMLGLPMMQQFGGLPRQLEQQYMDQARQEWMRTQPEYSPWLNYAMSFLGTPMMTQYGQTEASPWSKALGYGGSAASMLGNLGWQPFAPKS